MRFNRQGIFDGVGIRLASLCGKLPVVLLAIDMVVGGATCSGTNSSCRCFPDDKCWPKSFQWDQFNSTVGGKLLSTVPLAAICHHDGYAAYDAAACKNLQDNWFYPEPHLASSSSPMAYLFTNNTCSPFTPESDQCTLGNLVSYAVEATSNTDIQNTLAFAQKNNLRLVVRTTGHDYNGKSTGAGALGLWLHRLQDISYQKTYMSLSYIGPAITVGPGVSIYDAYKFANDHNGIIVGGNCPTVSLAGGYTQGGGHGPLASTYGLAADQVLEYKVITADGTLVTASLYKNSDLYWALSGGGGGTFGVVVAMTVKVHPQQNAAAASLSFSVPNSPNGTGDYWDAVSTFISTVPKMVESGLLVAWTALPGSFSVLPASGPNATVSQLDSFFQPTLSQLNRTRMPYQYNSQSFPTWLASYEAFNLPSANVSNAIIGSRLIPRTVIDEQLGEFVSAVKNVVDNNFVAVGNSLDVSSQASNSKNIAANPYWRKTTIHLSMGTYLDYQNFGNNQKSQDLMTNTLLPRFAALTPNGAAYLNEADYQQPDWQSVLYGQNYAKLSFLKMKYDPHDLFYALQAVGSERWTQKSDGRLCRA